MTDITKTDIIKMNGATPVEVPEPDPLISGIDEIVRNSEQREVTRPVMAMAEAAAPFSQHEHDLMLKSVDHVANNWITQLRDEKQAAEALEQKVIERLSKLKGDLTTFFLMGHAVHNKVKRDHEFNEKLNSEIDKLAEEQA